MKRIARVVMGAGIITGMFIGAVSAQEALTPPELKHNLPRYKNRYIQLEDIYVHHRAGVPLQLSKAGYESSKYYTFGLKKSGIRCFLRRTLANENILEGIRNGQKITVTGYLKQPKMTVREGTRFRDTVKLDIFIIEVRDLTPGWK